MKTCWALTLQGVGYTSSCSCSYVTSWLNYTGHFPAKQAMQLTCEPSGVIRPRAWEVDYRLLPTAVLYAQRARKVDAPLLYRRAIKLQGEPWSTPRHAQSTHCEAVRGFSVIISNTVFLRSVKQTLISLPAAHPKEPKACLEAEAELARSVRVEVGYFLLVEQQRR